ncbi:MAG: cell division FtsA domain-containing protein [Planctomycetes bacterium]|nr:cell division FtsA domain-containing protein [Planctomycetota bacterium]
MAAVFTAVDERHRLTHSAPSFRKVLSNGAAPLDQVSLAPLRASFERIFFLAKELAGKVHDGLTVKEARRVLSEEGGRFPAIPPEEDRTAFLIQETIGGLHGPCCEASTPPGLYAVVDIGAGTTNVTFFRLGSGAGRGRTFAYYSSHTEIVGGDDIDRAILSRVVPASSLPPEGSQQHHEILQRIRLGKQDIGSADLELWNGVRMPNAEVRSAIREVGERIYEVYRRAFKNAYLKEMRGDRWREYTVLLLGGSSWVHGMEELFERRPHDIVERVNVMRPKQPKRIAGWNGGPITLGVSDYILINLSHGLSTERPNIPDYFAPDQVEPLPLPPPPVERDVEELYPK